MYARMMNLRKGNRPKILLAIGGWNHGSGKFSDMVQNKTKLATFVTTTIIFLQKHNFDGLDIDWVKRRDEKKGREFAFHGMIFLGISWFTGRFKTNG